MMNPTNRGRSAERAAHDPSRNDSQFRMRRTRPGDLKRAEADAVMSEDIKQKIQEELQKLEAELRTEIPAELKKAVAMGDLSENAEYESARNRQDYVRARIMNLRKRLGDFAMIDTSRLPRDKVSYGSTVVLYDVDAGDEITYTLVMSEDSDVSQGKISTTSPIGRGLMGRGEGDEVEISTPAGKRRFEIITLRTIHQNSESLS